MLNTMEIGEVNVPKMTQHCALMIQVPAGKGLYDTIHKYILSGRLYMVKKILYFFVFCTSRVHILLVNCEFKFLFPIFPRTYLGIEYTAQRCHEIVTQVTQIYGIL